ncbi:MAG: hypothetical protein ACR2NP_15790 [Pirellulaceae bacterium]
MYKFLKTCLVLLLPLMATAVLYAVEMQTQTHLNASANIEELMEAAWETRQDDGLDNTLRAHYLRLNEDNRLSGEISAIQNETGEVVGVESLEVTLVQESKVISRTNTDSTGFFITEEVEPGTYTLCVSGDDGFLAYGIQIIERDDPEAESLPLPVPGEGDDNAVVGRKRLQLASFSGANAVQEDGEVKITAAVIPPEFTALRRIMEDYVPAGLGVALGTPTEESQVNVKDSVIAGGFQISLTEDGKLIGRVAPLTSEKDEPIRLQEMNAFLLLDDEIYARASIGEDGNFEFNEVEPNVYGFAAAGMDGFAALSFQAVEPEDDRDLDSSFNSDKPFRNAAATTVERNVSGKLNVAIGPKSDIPYLRSRIETIGRQREFAVQDATPKTQMVQTGQGPGGPGMAGFGGWGGYPGGGWGGGYGNVGGFGDWGGIIRDALGAWVLAEALGNTDGSGTSIGNVRDGLVTTPTIVPPTQLPPVSPFF